MTETTEEFEFYSPWPKFGKHLSNQWSESRQNAEVLHPIVRAAGIDTSYTDSRTAAVQSFEVGEQDFHNKYRIFWDKTNTSFRIQFNNGTTSIPSWIDNIVIDTDGKVHGDFYISAVRTVTTTDLGGSITPVQYRDNINLKFNRSDFYITTDSQGSPIINLAR